MTRYRWLDRRISAPGPYLTLCLTAPEFQHALHKLKVQARPDFVKPGADATTHHMTNGGASTCIVCLQGYEGRNPIEVAGILVHEAVHIWQEYCNMIGERNPGVEQEAYAVQSIAQELMSEFARRME
jgi:hypothetical protein